MLTQQATEKDAAVALNLSEYITVEAVRLSQRIAISAKLHNKHGTVLYQTQTTAYSLDDMQPVSERIAAALKRRTDIENTQTLDTVTLKEGARPNRTFTEKVLGVRTGVVFPAAIIGEDFNVDPMLLMQFDARLEGTVYFLEFGGGFMFPSNFDSGSSTGDSIGGLVGHLGASYYLTQTSISPYLGAGVSPRLMFGDFSGGGLAVNLQGGVMFMRTSSARIYAELRVDQNLIPLSPNLYDYCDFNTDCTAVNDWNIYPTELTLAVGIGW